ncbi:MAG: prepilin-type N-terminal cleavage/methylation domain-containing protein [Desulfocapsaceae bacterium]|nr:prepilin-type N-terminal cleavage/methylation domain-containing protein [Desulfocapsaceae bacterium]
MKNDNGFSLLEAMIAIFILSVGIIGAAFMQIQAIRGNDTGMARTAANNIGLSVMEELQRLPFDDPRTCQNGLTAFNAAALNNGSSLSGGAVNPAAADHQFSLADFPNFPNTYKFINNSLVDDSGRAYQIFWNVNKDPFKTGVQPQPSCVINLFVYWQAPWWGQQYLQYTTLKYSNIKIGL